MFVGPAADVDIGPQFRLFRADDANFDVSAVLLCRLFHDTIEHVADLDRPVVASAKEIESRHSHKRTYFMLHGSAPFDKEALDEIQRRGRQIFEYTEAERLGDRRIDAIEYCISTGTFDPAGAGFGIDL